MKEEIKNRRTRRKERKQEEERDKSKIIRKSIEREGSKSVYCRRRTKEMHNTIESNRW